MHKISTEAAPQAIGPYSQALRCNQWVFLSGQLPLSPQTQELVEGDMEQQIVQIFENFTAICQAAGGSLAEIVKINVYLCDLTHFAMINQVMERYFSEPFPARAAVQVSALPKGAAVEMDGIMILERTDTL